MQYNRLSGDDIEVKFETATEVAALRAAYLFDIDRLIAHGNDSSITDHDTGVLGCATGDEFTYTGSKDGRLAERLERYADATEENGDSLLDEFLDPERIAKTARRYELGAMAQNMLDGIREQQADESLSE